MSLPVGIFRRRFLDQLQRLNVYVKADPAIHLIGIQVNTILRRSGDSLQLVKLPRLCASAKGCQYDKVL